MTDFPTPQPLDIDRQLSDANDAFISSEGNGPIFQSGIRYAELLADKGHYQQAIDVLTKISPLVGNEFDRGLVAQRCGWAYLRISQYDKALYYLREALKLLGTRPGSIEMAQVYHDMAWMHYRQGFMELARTHAENAELVLRCRPQGQDQWADLITADCHHLFSLIESAAGHYPEAIARAEQGVAILEKSGDILRLSAAYNKISSIYQAIGSIVRAFEYQRRSLELATRSGNPYRRSISLKNLGELHFITGDLDQAAACHAESLALSLQVANILGYIFNHAGLGRILQARGDPGRAEEELWLALDKCREIKCRDRESALLVDLADLCCDCRRFDEAGRHLEQALMLDNQRGQDPSPWHAVVSARTLLGSDQPGRWQEAAEALHGVLAGNVVIDDEQYFSVPEMKMAARLLLGTAYDKLDMADRARDSYALAKLIADGFCREFTPEQRELFRRRRLAAEIAAAGGP
jgi:tetratricopeptide (TPR) repeat protein